MRGLKALLGATALLVPLVLLPKAKAQVYHHRRASARLSVRVLWLCALRLRPLRVLRARGFLQRYFPWSWSLVERTRGYRHGWGSHRFRGGGGGRYHGGGYHGRPGVGRPPAHGRPGGGRPPAHGRPGGGRPPAHGGGRPPSGGRPRPGGPRCGGGRPGGGQHH